VIACTEVGSKKEGKGMKHIKLQSRVRYERLAKADIEIDRCAGLSGLDWLKCRKG